MRKPCSVKRSRNSRSDSASATCWWISPRASAYLSVHSAMRTPAFKRLTLGAPAACSRYLGKNPIEAEFSQSHWRLGGGPSGKTCPSANCSVTHVLNGADVVRFFPLTNDFAEPITYFGDARKSRLQGGLS